ncbi:MAG: N-6 DNA methylase [Pirellulaceae bacterium]|nr:N-6 DNA methylase [Pirellulaceae bacterium]
MSRLEDGRDLALQAAAQSLREQRRSGTSREQITQILAQAQVCASDILATASRRDLPRVIAWLGHSLSPWQRWVVETALTKLNREHPSTDRPSLAVAAHRYEQLLHELAPADRKRHGVFYTPATIARYIVAEVDRSLRRTCQLPHGLSAATADAAGRQLAVIDPACGTGVFLLAVIDHWHAQLREDWPALVPHLLPRLAGVELLPVPALLAKLNIALKLLETGYTFDQSACIQVHCADALAPETWAELPLPRPVLPVIVGNPPFASLTTVTNPWIARLLRGDEEVRGYTHAGDQRLGERKTWLHDDYVKFIRLAQWQVEESGGGIVGFVTNHGYLSNATFRLMRHELLRVFPSVRLVDLHGNRKSGGGSQVPRDENVFGIDQGMAIAILSRPPLDDDARHGQPSPASSQVEYAALWGSRESKLAAMETTLEDGTVARSTSALAFESLAPADPQWSLVPGSAESHPEYASGWSLADAMPVHTSAPVTARDHFLVAFSREELLARLAEFRDLSITDATIRAKYFTRTRSSRYPPGDSRGWQLAAARRIIAADDDWQSHIVRCLYRPFDWRYVYWHPAMVDWPRTAVTRHLIREWQSGVEFQVSGLKHGEPANVCLIARRQQLASQPCTFFWVADGLVLDGVIRSDNRGSESLFPLWLFDESAAPNANFASDLVSRIKTAIDGPAEPWNLLGYIYALFHSPTYRARYEGPLRADFPRVLIPGSRTLFDSLARVGRQLVDVHLLRAETAGIAPMANVAARDQPNVEFRVGGYEVLHKWLQPKHRSTSDPQYAQIVAAIAQTQRLMAQIDHIIGEHGGYPGAFAAPGSSAEPTPV